MLGSKRLQSPGSGFRTQLRDYLGRELEQKLKWEDNERAPRRY